MKYVEHLRLVHMLYKIYQLLSKRDTIRTLPSIYHLFTTGLINSIIPENNCEILFIIG